VAVGGVALIGPTASGKTSLALGLARTREDVELVSVDSMAVYRGMDIGTAKPLAHERRGLTVHMIDLVDPSFDFTVSHYQSGVREVMRAIADRDHRGLLVGGTGLYLRSVTDDLRLPGVWPEIAASLEAEADALGTEQLHARLSALDTVAASRIEPSNRRRVVRALEVTLGSGSPFSSFGPGLSSYSDTRVTQLGIPYVASIHDDLIKRRFAQLLEQGLLEEVSGLLHAAQGMSRTARQAIGYKELISYLEGELSFDDACEAAVRRTRTLARRQWAWFRRDPRIVWLDPAGDLPGQLLEQWDLAGAARAAAARTASAMGD
jgi:tRNA dimethylallyltransferase